MPRDGTRTRNALMDAAEALILDQGFSATSIDRLIERAGVTKGTFFHHFPSKGDLARALVDRYAAADLALFQANRARAEALSRDPLQRVLLLVGLYREMMAGLDDPYPGCLFASYLYEASLFDDDVMGVIVETYQTWRREFGAMIEAAMAEYPPRLPADPAALADMFTTIIEGAFIMSKTLDEAKLVAVQLGQYRDYLELLFAPAD